MYSSVVWQGVSSHLLAVLYNQIFVIEYRPKPSILNVLQFPSVTLSTKVLREMAVGLMRKYGRFVQL